MAYVCVAEATLPALSRAAQVLQKYQNITRQFAHSLLPDTAQYKAQACGIMSPDICSCEKAAAFKRQPHSWPDSNKLRESVHSSDITWPDTYLWMLNSTLFMHCPAVFVVSATLTSVTVTAPLKQG
jgi:hypothetical protein